ncbi:MAG: HNH endonuclease [Anaerolineae bacterium]|nr:HNH endonuclease [Anaerolineae bacterium]
MTYIPDSLRRFVRERAGYKCEYCLLKEEFTIKRHEIDHIIAEKHGGETLASNLCLCCHDCNLHKGSDLSSIDPLTLKGEFLFNPRLDNWSEHFQLKGALIVPLTAAGRVTTQLLRFNDTNRVMERNILVSLGVYP